MWKPLQEWSIAAAGIFLICGGLYLASLSTNNAETAQAKANPGDAALAAHPPSVSPAQSPPVVSAQPSSLPAGPSTPGIAVAPQIQPTQPGASMPGMDHDKTTVGAGASPPAAPAASSPSALPFRGGDPAAGRLVFRKCQVCHSIEAGKNILGPSLAGIVGRKSGSEPGYSYSPAMSQAKLVWDAKTLDAYLADQQNAVPGAEDQSGPRRRHRFPGRCRQCASRCCCAKSRARTICCDRTAESRRCKSRSTERGLAGRKLSS